MPKRRSRIGRSRGVGRRGTGRTGRGLKGVTAAGYGSARFASGMAGMAAGMAANRLAGKRRSIPMSQARRVRRRASNKPSGSGPLTRSWRKIGRKRKLTVRGLQRLSMISAILRYQGLKRYAVNSTVAIDEGVAEAVGAPDLTLAGTSNSSYPGYFVLQNLTQSDTINIVGDVYPLHITCLTSMPNVVTNGHNLHMEMQMRNTATAGVTDMEFAPLNGQLPTGTPTIYWQYEYASPPVSSDATVNNIQPNARSKMIEHQWFDIRFILYCQRQAPTMYDIMLVTFADECLDPQLTNAQVVALPAEQRAQRNALWQGLVRNITYNPILPANPYSFKGMRVIKRQRVTLQASSTDDADRTPDHQIVRWFVKDYRARNYNYGTRSLRSATAVDGPNYIQDLRVNDLQDECHPKQRMYLMIRATNTSPEDALLSDMDGTPSYDMVIRKRVTYTSQT